MTVDIKLLLTFFNAFVRRFVLVLVVLEVGGAEY